MPSPGNAKYKDLHLHSVSPVVQGNSVLESLCLILIWRHLKMKALCRQDIIGKCLPPGFPPQMMHIDVTS